MVDKNDPTAGLSFQDRFEAYLKLADFYIARFDGRREYEWKVTLGFWAAILGSAATFRELAGKLELGDLLYIAIAIFFAHWLWLWSVWRAHRFDKNVAFAFSREAAKLLNAEPEEFKRIDPFCLPPAMVFQLFTTALILIIVIIYFTQSIGSS